MLPLPPAALSLLDMHQVINQSLKRALDWVKAVQQGQGSPLDPP